MFVQWTDPFKRKGRQVALDDWDRVVTIVAYRVPVESFEDASILIKRTGVVLMRLPRSLRPPMHDWCLRIQWEALSKRFSGPYRVVRARRDCAFCCAVEASGASPKEESGDVYRCSLCLLFWHARCSGIDMEAAATVFFVCVVCASSANS